MNNLGTTIRKMRESKGLSQEYMAQELEISQATYARMENENTKITVQRLLKIAEILQREITDFFTSSKVVIETQNNSNGANGYVEHLYMQNQDVYEKLLAAKDAQITFLQELLQKK